MPIVATRVGAIPDVVIPGDIGYLMETGDINCLAQWLIQLLDDPAKCRAFGEQGSRLVRENYNWEAVGRRMKEQITATLQPAPRLLA